MKEQELKRRIEAMCADCCAHEGMDEDCMGYACPLYGLKDVHDTQKAFPWWRDARRQWKHASFAAHQEELDH